MQKVKIIKFPVGSAPFVLEIDDSLEAMQEQVGGSIEIVGVGALDLVCNEEGLILKLDFNRVMGGHRIHGDFFLVRHDEEGNMKSVTADDIAQVVK